MSLFIPVPHYVYYYHMLLQKKLKTNIQVFGFSAFTYSNAMFEQSETFVQITLSLSPAKFSIISHGSLKMLKINLFGLD